MAFSYNLSEDVGKVRLLIPDRNPSDYVFDDVDIQAFLDLEEDIRLAAALGLETIASDNAMTLKVIRLLDLTTDGAKVSDALLKRAEKLRDQYESEGGGFEIVEVTYDQFSREEKLWKEALRSG